jgi:hypothetical protein
MRALRHDLMDLRYTLAENGASVSETFHARRLLRPYGMRYSKS